MKKPLVKDWGKSQTRPAGFQPPPPSVSQNKKGDGQSTNGKGRSSQMPETSPPTTFPFAPPKPPPPTDEQVEEMIEQIREDRSSKEGPNPPVEVSERTASSKPTATGNPENTAQYKRPKLVWVFLIIGVITGATVLNQNYPDGVEGQGAAALFDFGLYPILFFGISELIARSIWKAKNE